MNPESTPRATCPQLLVDSFMTGQIRFGYPETALHVSNAQEEAGGAGICLQKIITDIHGPAEAPTSTEVLNQEGSPVTVPVVFGPAEACSGVCWFQQKLHEQA